MRATINKPLTQTSTSPEHSTLCTAHAYHWQGLGACLYIIVYIFTPLTSAATRSHELFSPLIIKYVLLNGPDPHFASIYILCGYDTRPQFNRTPSFRRTVSDLRLLRKHQSGIHPFKLVATSTKDENIRRIRKHNICFASHTHHHPLSTMLRR